jgi:glutaminyl-tRNA synthetase
MPDAANANSSPDARTTNFLRNIVERDLEQGTYANRHFAGSPGDAAHQASGPLDVAKIRTRFPPEPNGYFGLANDYGGVCHMRFDDTNPEKEEQEYVDSILDAVKWLGFSWDKNGTSHLYHASDYFDFMYRAAQYLIESGHAYVDAQSAEQIRESRGSFTEAGKNSPWRDRPAAESLKLFEEMKQGLHADGSLVLRAKIDMASPNINMRDPAIYRIRHAEHHRTGTTWCVYPMYTYAHPIEDALEQITHSICTLEFEDQRPFYDWLIAQLIEGGLLPSPPPRQYEFARLNLTYIITSKRKLRQLIEDKHVQGWDDPRMPTVLGLRRRGYTPESLRLLADRTGASKNNSWIEYSVLEGCLRDDLDAKAPRAMAVIDPIKLIITNFTADQVEACSAPVHPHQPELGTRDFKFTRKLWIDREDFQETPEKGYHRLFVGNLVRLKYGFVVKCTGFSKDAEGRVNEVHAEVQPDSKSGTPGSATYKVKGVITWVSAIDAVKAELRLYDRLFTDAQPDAGGKDFIALLNPNSKRVVMSYLEPSLANAKPDDRFQFERWGYFVADRVDHASDKPVFNRICSLKDNWGK